MVGPASTGATGAAGRSACFLEARRARRDKGAIGTTGGGTTPSKRISTSSLELGPVTAEDEG